jgi:hypothetical protein
VYPPPPLSFSPSPSLSLSLSLSSAWNAVMFRFAKYDNTHPSTGKGAAQTYVAWKRRPRNIDNQWELQFADMFEFGHRDRNDPGGQTVCGWYKATKDGTRGTQSRFLSEAGCSNADCRTRTHCIRLMHFHNSGTISERHQAPGGSDQWIDMCTVLIFVIICLLSMMNPENRTPAVASCCLEVSMTCMPLQASF